MGQTLVQMHAPADIRGRVIGLYSMASLGLRAFSGVTVGILGSAIGIRGSLALSAPALLALTAFLLGFTLKPAAGVDARLRVRHSSHAVKHNRGSSP